jgi:cytoskeletal protein CcmA (bactofilin family)
VVDGEILKQSLTIEQNAQFEGVARRLDKTVEAPSQDQVDGGSSRSTSMAEIVPISGAIG